MSNQNACQWSNITETILDIRLRKGKYKELRRDFEVRAAINRTVIEYLDSNGKFYFDRTSAYYLDEDSHDLLILNPMLRRTQQFLSQSGLSPLDKEYQHLVKALEIHALNHGTEAKIYSFSHFYRETFTIYLFDQNKYVYKITTKKEIEKVPNGTDGILFLNKTGSRPFELISLCKRPDTNLFHDLLLAPLKFSETALSPAEYHLIISLYTLSIFMPELFPTKTILAIIGELKSGKTTFIRSLGRILSGSTFQATQLPNDPRSFDVLLASAHYIAIDNADSRVRWLDDRLAVAATGGTVKTRRLYSDSDLCELEITANLAISSRTPRFRRPDIADRCLIIPLEQIDNTTTPEEKIQREILENRNAILTETVFKLQGALRALEMHKDLEYQSSFRMADFGSFALKLAKYEGKHDQMLDILVRLNVKQEEFAAECDPVLDLLEYWAIDSDNEGVEISASDLRSELIVIAKEKGIKFPNLRTARSLAQKLSRLSRSQGHNLIIEKREAAGRKGLWSIRLKDTTNRDSNE